MSTLVGRPCRRSAILTPLNCPAILSPSRNEGEHHVESGRAEALVRIEPSDRRKVGRQKSGGGAPTQCSADPTVDGGISTPRSYCTDAWQSWAACRESGLEKDGESSGPVSQRAVLRI